VNFQDGNISLSEGGLPFETSKSKEEAPRNTRQVKRWNLQLLERRKHLSRTNSRFVKAKDNLPSQEIFQEYSTEPCCKITVLQGHHELAGNLSNGIEILLAICCYRTLAGSVFTKLFYGWKN